MERRIGYFEIRDAGDKYGLEGMFESSEKALEEINRSYERAKAQGYDNKANKWIIVCNERVKEFDKNGAFLKETIVRYAVEDVEFSTYENAFVFVY